MKRITDFFSLPSKRNRVPSTESASASPAAGECSTALESSPFAVELPRLPTTVDSSPPPVIDGGSIPAVSLSSSDSSRFLTVQSPSFDIGAIDKSVLSDADRIYILETPWQPPEGFQWPYSERMDGAKVRKKYLGPQHLSDQYSVFAYSISKKGLYCKLCVLFAGDEIHGIRLNRLVMAPLDKFAHLTGKDGYLTSHLSNKFHEDSVSHARALKQTMTSKSGDISQQLNTAAAQQRAKNRAALQRILLAVEYLGRLGLPLRGHRDSGRIPVPDPCCESDVIDFSQGNLRSTLQLMMACHDDVLRHHLETAGRNATYLSPRVQNEIITAVATVFRQAITAEVHDARFFSLLADETTDVSKKEQLTVCLRYVLKDFTIRERFLCFDEATDLTGLGLSTQLLTILTEAGIDITNMVGQGYDGAAAMSGVHNGVQKHIREKCPSATYVHCVSHSLNLCLLKAGQVAEIRKAVTLMQGIAVFYSDSNKRLRNLQECITQECPESSHTRLKQHCATRWVEHQESVRVFKELLPAVQISLDQIRLWPRPECSGKALIFSSALDGSFHVALEILLSVLEVTKQLSVKLQSEGQDIHHAMEGAKDALSVLQELRDDEGAFAAIFQRASDASTEEITMPRRTGQQRNRANHPANTTQQYYRRAVFLPYIDVCLEQMRERFQFHEASAYYLSLLLPTYCEASQVGVLKDFAKQYDPFLPGGVDCLETEFLRWKAYWSRQPVGNRPKRVLHALAVATELGTFPILQILLRIFATIPVTTATGERSFSALKLIKTYLRSTMREERLNGLAHLFINKDIKLVHGKVIDEFSKKNRKLSLA